MGKMLRSTIGLVCLLSGLIVPVAPASAGNDHMVEIRVARQETLIGICKKYLEHPETWRRIAGINRLADPDRISPGQQLKLPVEMLKGVPLEGTVTLLKGTVTGKTAGETDWKPLNLRDVIKAGSSLRTAGDSTVEITFEDGTSFLMRENSEVTLKRAGKGMLHLLRTLYLESGKVISRVKSATGRDSRFEVETPSALAAARGTEYRVAIDKELTTRLEALERSIDISSGGASVVVQEGEGSLARMNEPPTQPVRLPAPPEAENLASVYGDKSSEIRFSKVQNAAQYRVVLAQDPHGKRAVRTALIRPDEAFRFEGVDEGTYYLVASSIDGQGLEGAPSGPGKITVRKKPLPPTIISPSDSATLPEMPVKIRWHHVLGATAYQMQISTDRDFSGPLIESGSISETAYQLKKPQAGSYYLRVRSLAEGDYAGDWSGIREFSVVQLMPPSVTKPKDDDEHLYLEWAPIQGAAGYHLQISADEGFKVVTMDRTLGQTRLMLVNPLAPGTYYVRVSGIDSERGAGGFSQVGSFVVEERKHYWYEALGGAGVIGAVLLLLLL